MCFRDQMLAAAEPDLEREPDGAAGKDQAGLGGAVEVNTQPGQGLSQQRLLARPQRRPPLAAIQPLGGGLGSFAQRSKAFFSAGTRSVCSQVKLSSRASGSRPK